MLVAIFVIKTRSSDAGWARLHSLFSKNLPAELIPNGLLPLFILLRINHQRGTRLRMSSLRGNCGHTNVRIRKQQADEGMSKHMWMQMSNTSFLPHTMYNTCIAVRIQRPTMIITNYKIISCQRLQGSKIFAAFIIDLFLPAGPHKFSLARPICLISLHEFHEPMG